MSHPYRTHLNNSIGDDISRSKSPLNLDRLSDSGSINPHQVLSNKQTTANIKKPHPFLQHLPQEVSKSLESLHLTSSKQGSFESTSNNNFPSSGSTTSNNSTHSLNTHSNQNSVTQLSSIREMLSDNSSKLSQNSSKSLIASKSTQDSSLSKFNRNETPNANLKLPEVSLNQDDEICLSSSENIVKEKLVERIPKNIKKPVKSILKNSSKSPSPSSSILSSASNHNHIKDNVNKIQITNKTDDTNNCNDKDKQNLLNTLQNTGIEDRLPLPDKSHLKISNPLGNEAKDTFLPHLHERTRSTANLIHPVLNSQVKPIQQLTEEGTSQERDVIPNSLSTTTVNLLPLERSIDLYRQNARKMKNNPEVLFSFAQVLIMTSLSKRTENPLSDKEKQKLLDEACTALKRAAKLGYIEAQYYLGDAYSVGLFNKGKPELGKSLTYFETAGKSKHAESAYRTAICYKKGWGCTRDARKVVKFLEIAAMNNHPVAMMEYGIYAFHGLMGFPEDVNTKKSGISWLRRATECATELSCGAPYELALIHINGFKDIVIKDTNYAVRLLFQASNLGHAKSAALLGKFYEIGDIVEPNADLSIHFYNIAASLGDVDGMMGLCSWYFVGTDHLEQDYDEAFAWAKRAAESHKYKKAMLLLEKFYAKGIGCDIDMAKSKYWGDLAKEKEKKK